jgi:hypothetical protein
MGSMRSSRFVLTLSALGMWLAWAGCVSTSGLASGDDAGAGDAAPLRDVDRPDDGWPIVRDGATTNRCAEIDAGIDAGALCDGDYGSGRAHPCPIEQPVCQPNGTCTDGCGDCSQPPGHAGTSCGDVTRRCGQGCADVAACAPGSFCDGRYYGDGGLESSGACAAKLPNGITYIDAMFPFGSCAASGARVCASGEAFGQSLMCTCGRQPGAACTANAQCSDSRCNTDGRCGGRLGDLCVPGDRVAARLYWSGAECRSGVCSECACVRACNSDADCGNALSGIVCSADANCAPGCRGVNGNGCPYGKTCTSTDATPGRCVGDGG